MNAKLIRRTAMTLVALVALYPALALAGDGVAVSGAKVSGSAVQVRVSNSDSVPHSATVQVVAMTPNGAVSVEVPTSVEGKATLDLTVSVGSPVLGIMQVGITSDDADPI